MRWIQSSDPEKEVWWLLSMYLGEEACLQLLERRHGSAGKQKANFKKQAFQIRSALMQAREYFAAASQVSLATSPNLLYYGANCLATALMLVNGTGDRSLDALRQDGRNRRHGIEFTSYVKSTQAKTGNSLLTESSVRIEGHGHVANWYDTLPIAEVINGIVIRESNGALVRSAGPVLNYARPELASILGCRQSLFDLMATLPDLAVDMQRLARTGSVGRLTLSCDEQAGRLTYTIHGAIGEIDEILQGFRLRANDAHLVQVGVHASGAIIDTPIADEEPLEMISPDIRMAMNGNLYVFSRDTGRPEFLDAVLVSFGLSMLARYYPECWMTALESRSSSAIAAERFIGVYLLKFPQLVLGYLLNETVIATHLPPPWH